MIGDGFETGRVSSRWMYIQSTSDISPEWKDIRNSHIPPNQNDMRSIADIPKLCEKARSNINSERDIYGTI
jgi:hypothetical protein